LKETCKKKKKYHYHFVSVSHKYKHVNCSMVHFQQKRKYYLTRYSLESGIFLSLLNVSLNSPDKNHRRKKKSKNAQKFLWKKHTLFSWNFLELPVSV